jgi:hypothetical protein
LDLLVFGRGAEGLVEVVLVDDDFEVEDDLADEVVVLEVEGLVINCLKFYCKIV